MNSRKKISVVIATYNGEKYIEQQIKSNLLQLSIDDEIIISDDNSKDNTIGIVSCIGDTRIKVIQNRKSIGLIKNFQVGLKLVEGDYVFLSDQDDIWQENKVKIFLEYLKDYDVVQSDATIVDSNLQVLYPSLYALKGSRRGLIRNLWKNNYVGCNMAFKRKVLDVALPFPRHIPMHDIWIGFVTELFFSSFFIPEKLLLYRRHFDNFTQTGSKSPFSLMQKFKFRLNTVRYVPIILFRYLSVSLRFSRLSKISA